MNRSHRVLGAGALLLALATQPLLGTGIYEGRVRSALEKYTKKHGLLFVPSDTVPLDEVRKISGEIDSGRDGRQTDTSALAGTFANIIDQPTTTNFLALALQSGAFQEARQDQVVTLTASLYALKRFVSPTPWASMADYAADRNLRRLSGSLSYGEVGDDKTAVTREVRSWTVRYTFGSRDLRDFYQDPDFTLMADLHTEIRNVIQEALNQRYKKGANPDTYTEDEITVVLESTQPQAIGSRVASVLGVTDARASLPTLIAAFSDALLRDKVKSARRHLVGSVALSHTRPANGQPGNYQLQAALQQAFSENGLLTLNLTGVRTEGDEAVPPSDPTANIRYGVVVATEVAWTLRKFQPLGQGDGTRLSATGFVDAAQTQKPKFKAQAKVELLLSKGVSIPLSVTWANRTDLIDEKVVRGNIGLSFDAGTLLTIAAAR